LAGVTFEQVGKTYAGGEAAAVVDLSLEIDDGQLVVLVGPSGCGKTTALRMVAGLEDITSGVIRIGDRVVNHVAARDRDIAMVFQSYALYPHLDVYDNIAFSLKLRGVAKSEIEQKVQHAARLLGLDEFLKRKPRALSGGQRQRVAMGRAIVREPAAFLMDEPLSNLDAKLRVQMRAEISELQRSLGVTTIYVTHDQVEAMTLGDRVAVMRKGALQQVDHPEVLYERPVNLFVGGFIGSPAMNVLDAAIERENGGLVTRVGDARIPLPHDALAKHPRLESHAGRPVILGIRPENLEDASLAPDEWPTISGKVRLREALGSEVMIHVDVEARQAVTDAVRELAADAGADADELDAGENATIVGRFDAHSRVRTGERVEIAVDTRSLHFFDPETGLGIYDDETTGQGGST
jgi:multiple sugar transport system ATP-binding protein